MAKSSITLKTALGVLILIFVVTSILVRRSKTELNDVRLIIQSREAGNLTIELDGFSGRPNPTWKLTKLEETMLDEMAVNLPTRKVAVELPAGLGYRGFIIRDSRNFDEINVSTGTVQADLHQWNDADKKVELFLLNTSKLHIESDIYEMIVKQLLSQ